MFGREKELRKDGCADVRAAANVHKVNTLSRFRRTVFGGERARWKGGGHHHDQRVAHHAAQFAVSLADGLAINLGVVAPVAVTPKPPELSPRKSRF